MIETHHLKDAWGWLGPVTGAAMWWAAPIAWRVLLRVLRRKAKQTPCTDDDELVEDLEKRPPPFAR